MESDKSVTGPVNIGNPCEFSMLELANLIIKETKSQSTIVFEPLPKDDPKQRQPNIALAKSKLNWEPEVDLSDGLKKTIAYFKSII
jgi:UDP-glucuronate decarboxylase